MMLFSDRDRRQRESSDGKCILQGNHPIRVMQRSTIADCIDVLLASMSQRLAYEYRSETDLCWEYKRDDLHRLENDWAQRIREDQKRSTCIIDILRMDQ